MSIKIFFTLGLVVVLCGCSYMKEQEQAQGEMWTYSDLTHGNLRLSYEYDDFRRCADRAVYQPLKKYCASVVEATRSAREQENREYQRQKEEMIRKQEEERIAVESIDTSKIPYYDENNACKSIPESNLYARNECLRSEQRYYDYLKYVWNDVSDKTRRTCIRLAQQTSGFYGVLGECIAPYYELEMGRRPFAFKR